MAVTCFASKATRAFPAQRKAYRVTPSSTVVCLNSEDPEAPAEACLLRRLTRPAKMKPVMITPHASVFRGPPMLHPLPIFVGVGAEATVTWSHAVLPAASTASRDTVPGFEPTCRRPASSTWAPL